MPIRPDDAANLTKDIRDMYVRAEGIIIQKIAHALAKGIDAPDWLEQRLYQQRILLRELDRLIGDLDAQVPGALEKVTALAYNRGISFAAADAAKAGVTGDIFQRIKDTGVEVALARAAMEPIGSMRYSIRRWTADIYDRVTQYAAQEVASGVVTRREASARMLQRLAGNGVTGFVDRSGRNWNLASYAEMAARTSTAQAMLQGHSDRLLDLGVDTVIVSNAQEECKTCRSYEGRVLSLTGRTRGTLSDGKVVVASLAEAKGKGLYHPNCRHSHSIYLPGITRGPGTDTADPAGDSLRKEQRAKERRIRELKQRDVIFKELDPDSAQAKTNRSKLRTAQSEFTAWRDENDRKNLGYRTNIKAR